MARGRKRIIAGWGLIVVGLAFAALLVTSRWCIIGWASPGNSLFCVGGAVTASRTSKGSPFAASLYPAFQRVDRPLAWWLPGAGRARSIGVLVYDDLGSTSGWWSITVLIWPWAAAPLAGGWLLRRSGARARIPAGLCPHCRYDRSGLPPDAPCPECGPRTPVKA